MKSFTEMKYPFYIYLKTYTTYSFSCEPEVSRIHLFISLTF